MRLSDKQITESLELAVEYKGMKKVIDYVNGCGVYDDDMGTICFMIDISEWNKKVKEWLRE